MCHFQHEGTRTIATNWKIVDIEWLVKIKTDSAGNVHYEKEKQPHNERTVVPAGSQESPRLRPQLELAPRRPPSRPLVSRPWLGVTAPLRHDARAV